MNGRTQIILTVAAICALIGAAVDFIFNGLVIGTLFHTAFSERWMFVYLPLDFAVAATLSTYLVYSRWNQAATQGTIAFALGALVAHVGLVDHHGTRVYQMNLVQSNDYYILRSDAWPQILFVSGDKVEEKLSRGETPKDKVQVDVAVVTDYGCTRSAVVSTVADVDVMHDRTAAWTWRLNRFSNTSENDGPGMEDVKLPWCRHPAQIKEMGDGPVVMRPWDEQLQNGT